MGVIITGGFMVKPRYSSAPPFVSAPRDIALVFVLATLLGFVFGGPSANKPARKP